MASVISALTPAARGQHEDDSEQRASVLQLDNAGEILASSGPLFEDQENVNAVDPHILFGWKTNLGADIHLESLIEQARCEIAPLSIKNATNARARIDGCEISILPQFSAIDSLVNGVSVVFRSTGHDSELASPQIDFKLVSQALQSSDQAFWFWKPEVDELYEYGVTRTDSKRRYTKAEFIDSWIHEDDRSEAFKVFEALVNDKISQFDLEQRFRQEDGTYRWLCVRGGVLSRDENGQITLVGGFHSDISDFKELQEALEDKIRAQTLTLDSSRVSSWEWFPNENGRLELSGIWRDQLNCKNRNGLTSSDEFVQLVHPDDLLELNSALERCLNGEQEALELECRLQNRDGVYIHILSRGRVVKCDPLGRPTHVIGTFTDIHELKLHQTRLDLALANGRQALWEWQSDGNLLTLSESWHALFGYEINEVVKFNPDFSDLLHPEDFSRVSKSFGMLLQNPEHTHRVEYRLRHKHGHYLWVADQGVVVERDADDNALRAIGSHVDISAHRDAMQEAKDSRAFLQLILDEIPDKIFWKDPQHRLLGCNKAYSEVLGNKSPKDIIGRSTSELYPRDLAQMYERDDTEVLNSGIPHVARGTTRS